MLANTIHFILGPRQDTLIKKCLKSWQPLTNYGFQIRTWLDADIANFIEKHYRHMMPALQNARNHAEVADIARYAIIHYYGGYYMDWDIELLDPFKFNEICLSNPKGFVIQDTKNNTLVPEAFSALPGESFLESLLNNIKILYECGVRDFMDTPNFSGPFRMREVFYATNMKTNQNILKLKNMFLYDYEDIRDFKQKNRQDIPLLHYWVHSWM